MKTAPIIVVEGLDGVGKTTLSKALAASLGASWLTTPGAPIREVRAAFDAGLADSPVARAVGYGATVLAAGARAQRIAASGRPVVIDRFWLSTRVYAVPEADAALAALEPYVPPPTLTLFAWAPEEVRRARLGGRTEGLSEGDLETLVGARARELAARYRALATSPAAGRFIELDCSGAASEVLAGAARVVARAG
jgi:dTMP kinase